LKKCPQDKNKKAAYRCARRMIQKPWQGSQIKRRDAPQTFAEYPDQEERAEEMTVIQVDQP
jgi:hypothetical protein